MGRDVTKLKGKGGGKFKYMSEKEMLELAAKFAPYRYVTCPAAMESLPRHSDHELQEPFYVVHVADRKCRCCRPGWLIDVKIHA